MSALRWCRTGWASGGWAISGLAVTSIAVTATWQTGTTELPKIPPKLSPHRPPPTVPCPLDRVLAYWTMGGQNGQMVDQMHSSLIRLGIGWPEFVDDYIVPDLQSGYEGGVMIHLPFAKDSEADPLMSFDSYIHAQERRLELIWRRFARAIRPVVRGKYTDGRPVRVVCYLGSLKDDPDFVRLLEKRGRLDDWLRRVWRSTRVILDAGCEIAFDTAGTWSPDEPAYAFVMLIRNMGAGGWIEGTELVRRPADQPWRWREGGEWHYWNPELIEFRGHWRGFNVTANHGHYWRNMTKTGHPSSQWDSIEHYGEVILLLNGHSAPLNADGSKKPQQEIWDTAGEWMPPMIQQDIAAGFLVAVSGRMLKHAGVTIQQAVGCPDN